MKTTTHTHPAGFIARILRPALLLALAATVFQACDNQSSTSGSQKKYRLAYVANTASEYWSAVQLGCQFAASQAGDVDLQFRVPTEHTAKGQQEVLNDLLAHGVDGIAISPIDADSQTEFLNNVAAKTLLVCSDSDAEKSKRVCYIGTDNVTAGKQLAELLKSALPQGGKVAVFVGYPGAQNTKDRVQGLQEGLTGTSIQIVDTLVDDHKSTVAVKNAQEALTKNPDLAAMVGVYGYHGPALLTALHAANKTKAVKIVCFDEDSDTLAGIVAGDIFGTVVQQPLGIGRQSINRMAAYLRGDKSQLASGKVLIPVKALTNKEDVEQFQNVRRGTLQP